MGPEPQIQNSSVCTGTYYGNREDTKEALRYIVLPAKVQDLKNKTRASAVYCGQFNAEGQLEPVNDEIADGNAALTLSHYYVIESIAEGPCWH